HHITAKNEAQALKKIKAIRAKAFSAIMQKRAMPAIQKIAENLKNDQVFVGVKDSLDAGNCKSGTLNFASKKQINLEKIGGVRADWLLENPNGSTFFVQKAVNHAKIRIAKMIFEKKRMFVEMK